MRSWIIYVSRIRMKDRESMEGLKDSPSGKFLELCGKIPMYSIVYY